MRRILGMLALMLWASTASADQAALLETLRGGGHVLLIRHAATESGLGDPPDFRLGECKTQRNLSAAGRAQSTALGEWFKAERIPLAEVRSSQWCRCVDTAELAFGGAFAIQPWPVLNSFFEDRQREPMQRAAALADLQRSVSGNRVWVTHQVNITSLTGVFPAMGEVVVARPGPSGLELVGRLRPE